MMVNRRGFLNAYKALPRPVTYTKLLKNFMENVYCDKSWVWIFKCFSDQINLFCKSVFPIDFLKPFHTISCSLIMIFENGYSYDPLLQEQTSVTFFFRSFSFIQLRESVWLCVGHRDGDGQRPLLGQGGHLQGMNDKTFLLSHACGMEDACQTHRDT